MFRFPMIFAALVLSLIALPSQAEVLLMDTVKQQTGANVPSSGLTMDAVRKQYGEPRKTVPAVGEPPIARWIYDGFTVYFENNRVIHAVVHRQQR